MTTHEKIISIANEAGLYVKFMTIEEIEALEKFEELADEGYRKYRGNCKELSEAACVADPTLTLVRGHYFCPLWNSDEPHWWCVRLDGTIHDPSKEQFPSRGHGIYTPFDGMVTCAECGNEVNEEDADIEGNYAFCSYKCHGRFVGVF